MTAIETTIETAPDAENVMSREELRDIALNLKPEFRIVTFCGQQVEVRQPSLRDVMNYQSLTTDDRAIGAARMIQQYTYMVGSNVRLFEPGDDEVIAGLPMSHDIQALQAAIIELTNFDEEVSEEIKN